MEQHAPFHYTINVLTAKEGNYPFDGLVNVNNCEVRKILIVGRNGAAEGRQSDRLLVDTISASHGQETAVTYPSGMLRTRSH